MLGGWCEDIELGKLIGLRQASGKVGADKSDQSSCLIGSSSLCSVSGSSPHSRQIYIGDVQPDKVAMLRATLDVLTFNMDRSSSDYIL